MGKNQNFVIPKLQEKLFFHEFFSILLEVLARLLNFLNEKSHFM